MGACGAADGGSVKPPVRAERRAAPKSARAGRETVAPNQLGVFSHDETSSLVYRNASPSLDAVPARVEAVGVVRDERVYQGDMGDGFKPFRKDVDWLEVQEAPIRPLLESLSFTSGKTNWGYALRFGLLKVTEADMDVIMQAMLVKTSSHAPR